MQVLISIEKQKVAEKEAETRKKIAIIKAEKNAHVSKILMQEKLTEKDIARMQEEIQNQAYLAREKSLADANFYRSKPSLSFFLFFFCVSFYCHHMQS